MRGVINGTYINRTIVNGAGWESFRTCDMFLTEADSVSASSGTTSLAVASSLQDGPDWMLGMTLTSVDANGPNASANHTATSTVGASVGAQSSIQVAPHGTALNSAVAVAAAMLGQQAAHQLLAEGKLDDLAAVLSAMHAAHTLSASATVHTVGESILTRDSDTHQIDGVFSVASMAQLMGGNDTLAALVRMLLAHRYGAGLVQHGPGSRLTPHNHGSKLTIH